MDSTIIDNAGNGVESDSLLRRALGMGGLSSVGDLIALSTSVLVLQREIKLCLRWFRPADARLVLRSSPEGSSSSSMSFRMPKNLLGGAFKDRRLPTFGGWRGIRVFMMNIYIYVSLSVFLEASPVQVPICRRNNLTKKESALLGAHPLANSALRSSRDQFSQFTHLTITMTRSGERYRLAKITLHSV